MSNVTNRLHQIYLDEVADVRRLKHYNKPELDLEEIHKRSVRMDIVSTHFERFMEVIGFFEKDELKTAEDYFYASFVLSQEEEARNQALGCMFAQAAQRLQFVGNESTPNIDKYVGQLQNLFFARLTGAK